MKTQQSISGKFVVFLLLLFSIHLSASTKVFPLNDALEETVRLKLNELIGNKNYSFQSLNVHESGKGLQGVGTFFSKKNVGFTIFYDTLSKNASFELDLPTNAKIGLNKNDVKSLTGASFQNMIPEALRRSLSLRKFNFKFNKEQKEISEVGLTFEFLKNWELLRFNKFSLNNIKVLLNIKYPKEGEKKTSSARLEGLTSIAGKPVVFSAILKEDQKNIEYVATVTDLDFKSSLVSLVGDASLGGVSIPEKLFDIKLPTTQLTVKPGTKSILFNSVATFGVIDGYINKVEKPKKGNKNYSYLLTITPHEDAKLSKLSDKLKILDKIDLSKQLVVLSSEEKSKEEKDKTPFKDKIGAGVKKGLNMVANFDLTKIKLDQLIGVKNLIISSPITAKLDQIVLESALETNIELGPTATLSNVIFRLTPSPKDFSISLLGEMSTKIGADHLIFQGGVEVVLTDQTLNFLAMMKGQWNDPLGARGLSVKNVGIQMGASFTTTPVPLPNIALAGEVSIGSFTGGATVAIDTRNPSKSMLSMNYNKIILMDLVELVISPAIKNKISPQLKKTLANFYSEDVFIEAVPVSMKVLDKHYEAGFRMNGSVSLAGLKGEAGFDIDYNKGMTAYGAVDPIKLAFFEFRGANGKPKPSFSMNLEANSTPKIIANGGMKLLGIETSADIAMVNNGYDFMVDGKVFNLYQATVKGKGTDLKKASDMNVDVALKNDFSSFLENQLKNFAANQTSGAIQKLTTAQSNVAKAQAKVKESDRHVASVKRIVEADQAKDRAKIQNARNKVNAAQKKVNQLKATLNTLNRQRDALPKFSPKRIPINTKIATTKTAHFTATKTLNGAKHVLNGLTKLNVDPNKDARLISARALHKTAENTLKGAQHTLNGLKWTLGKTGEVGSFIIEKGSDALVKVRKAGFKGALGKVHGAAVDLNLELDWLNKRQNITIKFNFNDAKASALEIAKKLFNK